MWTSTIRIPDELLKLIEQTKIKEQEELTNYAWTNSDIIGTLSLGPDVNGVGISEVAGQGKQISQKHSQSLFRVGSAEFEVDGSADSLCEAWCFPGNGTDAEKISVTAEVGYLGDSKNKFNVLPRKSVTDNIPTPNLNYQRNKDRPKIIVADEPIQDSSKLKTKQITNLLKKKNQRRRMQQTLPSPSPIKENTTVNACAKTTEGTAPTVHSANAECDQEIKEEIEYFKSENILFPYNRNQE
mmetsp:Transcript_7456/g.9454  ORF Transcript_7456/g.9454 Transcript_7456/m.9454 type:complete len:241 (-) Transcript_7456:1020-1742(-)